MGPICCRLPKLEWSGHDLVDTDVNFGGCGLLMALILWMASNESLPADPTCTSRNTRSRTI